MPVYNQRGGSTGSINVHCYQVCIRASSSLYGQRNGRYVTAAIILDVTPELFLMLFFKSPQCLTLWPGVFQAIAVAMTSGRHRRYWLCDGYGTAVFVNVMQ